MQGIVDIVCEFMARALSIFHDLKDFKKISSELSEVI